MKKTYEVILNHWQNGNGWTHGETFDIIDELCTPEEYINSLDCPLESPWGDDGDIRVEIWDNDKLLSTAWVSEC